MSIWYMIDWDRVWQILGPILGGIIAASSGLIIQLVIEARRKKVKRDEHYKRLVAYLIAFQNEIEDNIKILDKGGGGETQLVFTRIADAYLPHLGEIPLEETVIAMGILGKIYDSFDKSNQQWIKSFDNIHSNGAMFRDIRRRTIENILPSAKRASQDIQLLLKKVLSQLPTSYTKT